MLTYFCSRTVYRTAHPKNAGRHLRIEPLEARHLMAADVVLPRVLGAEDVGVGSFLRARLGSPVVDRLAGPLLGGVYGTPVDELSLDAVMPQLRRADSERSHRSGSSGR